jgi:hypothetical protein
MAAREKSLAEIQQPKNDAYTVMLSISLVAMIAACILLYQELRRYPTVKPTAKDMAPPPVVAPAGGDNVGFQMPDGGAAAPNPAGGAPEATKPEGAAPAKPQNPGGNP